MSREIKFRAWNSDDNKMTIPIAFAVALDGKYKPLIQCSDGNRAYKDYPLMQFTGLHDRTGKEIYEGDIVSYYELNPYVILYRDGFYLLENKELGDIYSPLWGECEVIGNIFKNPDLL
jgi:uncharacterized phage protein (TIGR01671 family)